MDTEIRFEIFNEVVCISHSAYTFGKEKCIQLFSIQLWVGQTGIFNLDMTISLGEGKVWIQIR